MADEGGEAAMDDASPQGPSKGQRGKGRQSGGKPQGESAPPGDEQAAAASAGEESGRQGGGHRETGRVAEEPEAQEEKVEHGGRTKHAESPAKLGEPPAKSHAELLRFERRTGKRRR